ncbi:hypothetical protein Y032_0460g1857 [Ancylostoma ceylanicum]|uniref:Uncharacterized protein n=1 Tax=Ancylostoma ceylanicum TaxID=53326 RepID=A0A016WXS3_9BILA|nr:hypothetical protein Y032_0460g1857 [Ancylostoma ceylanicum]
MSRNPAGSSSEDVRERLRVLRPHRSGQSARTSASAQDIREKLRRLRPHRHCPYGSRQPGFSSGGHLLLEKSEIDQEEQSRRTAICEWARSLPPTEQLNLLLYSQSVSPVGDSCPSRGASTSGAAGPGMPAPDDRARSIHYKIHPRIPQRALSPAHPHAAPCALDDMLRPAKFDYILNSQHLIDRQTQEMHAWNPDDRSLNIFVKDDDCFTFHRHPVAQSTDCIRGKVFLGIISHYGGDSSASGAVALRASRVRVKYTSIDAHYM